MKNRIFRVLTLSAVLLQTYCANLTFAEENKNLYLSNVKSIREKQLDAIDFILLNEIRDIANDTYKIHFSVLVNDLEGNNFVVAKFKPAGYGIYNIMNGDIMELSTNAEFNYTKNDLRNSYYVPTYGFIRKEKGKILNLRNKQFLTNAEFDYLSKHTNKLSKNYKHYMNIKNCETVRNYYDDSYFSLPKKQNTDSYLEIYDVTDAPEAEYEVPYTRIIEHKYFENDKSPVTYITKEYPDNYELGKERYYPINDDKNNALYAKYKEEASKLDNVIFGGRLANYKYYDMDDTIRAALDDAKKELKHE